MQCGKEVEPEFDKVEEEDEESEEMFDALAILNICLGTNFR